MYADLLCKHYNQIKPFDGAKVKVEIGIVK